MNVHICTPVLKRYDLLLRLIASLKFSSVQPKMVHIIDNGRNADRLRLATEGLALPIDVLTPREALGVAASWNWFIQNVPEERIIVNDDVTFLPRSLEQLLAVDAELVFAEGLGFSCFRILDSCVQKIGLFDEDISPGYAYYEDEDYLQRLDGHGTREASARSATVPCGALHVKSATIGASTPEELAEHHRRFKIAQGNYIRKWNLDPEEFFALKVAVK